MDIFGEFTLLLVIACGVGLIGMLLRQPLIVAFIVAGILVGPSAFDLVSHHQPIELLASVGITVLLFVVGLKLDLALIRHLGPVALATGLGQLAFTIVFGFLLGLAMGLDMLTAVYVAVALTFSSTIIIVKLLADKREIDSLHGRIAMGFLIVQDIAVVIAMMALGSGGAGSTDLGWFMIIAEIALKLVIAAILVAVAMRYILPTALRHIAKSQELLLLFAIAWGTLLAASGEYFGFSKEVGAFLAGFSLASTQYREAIGARLASLRDFLLLFFFIELGAKLDLSTLGDALLPASLFSLFVLLGNPLIVMAIMGYMGYRKRTSFMAGLTVAQISEFSIIFVAMGISLGHIPEQALGLVTLVGLVTIAMSTYMILYSRQLYDFCEPYLGVFQRRNPHREQEDTHETESSGRCAVIVFGAGRYGERYARTVAEQGLRVVAVDFDPQVTRRIEHPLIAMRYGDAADHDFIESLPLASAKAVVCTIPDIDTQLMLISSLQQADFSGQVIITAHQPGTRAELERAGVTDIVVPLYDAAEHAAAKLLHKLGEGAV
ncbi:cation:proton antiporter [Pseudidiomarina mangrovi]|uniref:cation:proton antiporter n=1 Tax=Pseudidiomarina mangrovi TaxID=2487133 RepID=UPI000FCB799C|nr:cation:proton antiporter family protein [Pseudidiomarina mangrovi]